MGRFPGCSGAGGIIVVAKNGRPRALSSRPRPTTRRTPKPLLPRRRLALALSLLALGAWTATGVAVAQEADLDAVLSRAVELHQSGDLEGASALYVQVLRAVPSAWRVRSNLGAAWAGLGRYEDAIDQYRQALQQEDDPSIRRNMAVALLKTGQTREAAVEAERALLAQPQDRDALLLLADCRLRLGETQAAIDILQPAAARGARGQGRRLPPRDGAPRLEPGGRRAGGDGPRLPRRLARVPRAARLDVREAGRVAGGGRRVRQGPRRQPEAAPRELPLRRGAHEGAQRLGGGGGRLPGRARDRPEPLRVEPAARHPPAGGGPGRRGAAAPRARGAAPG